MIQRRSFTKLGLGTLATLGYRQAGAQGRGKTITIAGGIDMSGVAPIDTWTTTPDLGMTEHLCDALLTRWKSYQVGPCLAESWRVIDDLTWEFTLRPGVEFHDGEKMTSESFRLFFEVVGNPDNRSLLRGTFADVREVRSLDERRFQVITREPTPALLNAFVTCFPLPANYIKRVGLAEYRRHPIGTGAFRFVERVRDQRYVLEANPNYWGGPQSIQRLVYRPIPEAAARIAALVTGEIDIALDLPPELMDTVRARPPLAIRSELTNRVLSLTLNYAKPELPTYKREVREAINFAIDRDSLVKDVLSGYGEPVAFQPPGIIGYDREYPPIKQDIARAKRLLAEAGYPDGVDLDFDTTNGRYQKDKEIGEAIAGQVAAAGIRMTVRALEWGVMQRRMYGGAASAVYMSAFGFSGDVYNYNVNNLRSNGTAVAGGTPELDAIIDASAKEMDPQRREQAVRRQMALMNQFYPKAFLLRMPTIAGVDPAVGAWKPSVDERIKLIDNTVLG